MKARGATPSHLVVTVTLNPCIDTVLFVDELKVGGTNRVQVVERDAGGKGINLARTIQKLGGNTIASGFLGGGPGAHVSAVLDGESVPHDFIHIAGETRTNVSVEDGAGPPTTFNEPGPPIEPNELEALIEEVKILSRDAGWLCIGGAIPPNVAENIFCILADIGHASGAKVALDADGHALRQGLKAGPDLIKPNIKEAEALLGRSIGGVSDCVIAAGELRGQLLHDQQRPGYEPFVIISMGSKGAVLASAEGIFVGTGPKITAISTIGSGDSMLGGFIWAHETGKPVSECFRWGLAAGAATAMSNGAEIGSKANAIRLLASSRVERCAATKVVSA